MKKAKIFIIGILSIFLLACGSKEEASTSEEKVFSEGDLAQLFHDVDYDYSDNESDQDEIDNDYTIIMNELISDLAIYTQKLIGSYDQLNETSDLLNNRDWMKSMRQDLTDIDQIISEVRKLNPEESYHSEYELILKAMDEYELIVETYEESIINKDGDSIELWMESRDSAIEYINDANDIADGRYEEWTLYYSDND